MIVCVCVRDRVHNQQGSFTENINKKNTYTLNQNWKKTAEISWSCNKDGGLRKLMGHVEGNIIRKRQQAT